jgi:hypothetical protein
MGVSARPLLRLGAICLAVAVQGCVLPIGPQFQDPPAAQNYDPVILDSDPDRGAFVTTPASSYTFRVTVQDPNVTDDVHVRFVADYLPLSENTRQLHDETVHHSVDGRLLSKDVTYTVRCTDKLANLPTHQITAIVADRPFVEVDSLPGQPFNPGQLPPGAGSISVTWTLGLECKTP